MADYDYDLLVIGAGSGGVRASRVAAELGAKVAIIEERYLGGTCVNVGCVPKKLFFYGSLYRNVIEEAKGFGWTFAKGTFDWSVLRTNKNSEIARLNQIYRDLLVNAGVDLFYGSAQIVDPHRVRVDQHEYTAERILIAVGGWPVVPDVPGCEFAITSNEFFFLEKLPKTIVIVGGGYVGAEFAGICNGFGIETHLCHRGDLLLQGFDRDIRYFVSAEIQKTGVHLHLNTDILRIEKAADQSLVVHLKDGSQWATDAVMYAIGRKPRGEELGLENTAVKLAENGSIEVDGYYQTHEPSIYALGDVVGHKALTPIALAEADILARNLFAGERKKLDYCCIPTAVFCQPNIASVGLTEEQVQDKGESFDVYQACFKPMQFVLADRNQKTFIKMLVDDKTDKILGCHMVGSDAAEIMQGMAIAIKAGATKKDFDNTVGIHPTQAEEFVTLHKRLP